MMTVATAPHVEWQTQGLDTFAFVDFSSGGDIRHIDDESGNNYRLFEICLTTEGIDYEDEYVPIDLLAEGVEEYARKNKTIVWEHKKEFPIALLLGYHINSDLGEIVIRGRVLDARDFNSGTEGDILKKANEVWDGMKAGTIRGASWEGRGRKQWVWSEALQQPIKKGLSVLLSDITLTSIPAHPGAQVRGLNTLSKALSFCKALTIGGEDKGDTQMDERVQAVEHAQALYLESLKNLEDGTPLPDHVLEVQEVMSKSMGLGGDSQPSNGDEDDEGDEAFQKHLAPLKQRIAELEGEMEPRRGVGNRKDGQAMPKPTEEGSDSFEETMTKSLQTLGSVRNNRLDYGRGDLQATNGEELFKQYLVLNDGRLHRKERDWRMGRDPEITFHPETIKFLDKQFEFQQ